MKLLLDENLSDPILPRIIALFPDSAQVKMLGLTRTDDLIIWEFAQKNGFAIVSKDSDFHQRSLVYGHPPKFIYLRVGNCPTRLISELLRSHAAKILAFEAYPTAGILILGEPI